MWIVKLIFELLQVCPDWRDTLYGQPEFWREVRPVLHCRDIRSWSSSANSPVSVTTSTTSGLSNYSRAYNVKVTKVKSTKVKVCCIVFSNFNAARVKYTQYQSSVILSSPFHFVIPLYPVYTPCPIFKRPFLSMLFQLNTF